MLFRCGAHKLRLLRSSNRLSYRPVRCERLFFLSAPRLPTERRGEQKTKLLPSTTDLMVQTAHSLRRYARIDVATFLPRSRDRQDNDRLSSAHGQHTGVDWA